MNAKSDRGITDKVDDAYMLISEIHINSILWDSSTSKK